MHTMKAYTFVFTAFVLIALGGCASGSPDPIKDLAIISVQEIGTCEFYKETGSDGVTQTKTPEAGHVYVDFLFRELDNSKSSKQFAFSPDNLLLNGSSQLTSATITVRGTSAGVPDVNIPSGQSRSFSAKHLMLPGPIASASDLSNTLFRPAYKSRAEDPSVIVNISAGRPPFPVKGDCFELP